ncbi:MAG: hypothetical protein AVDCRST_MAG60-670, partial [uncultured Nocardioides sp.]
DAVPRPGLGADHRSRGAHGAHQGLRTRAARRSPAAAVVRPGRRAAGAEPAVRTRRDLGPRHRPLVVGRRPHRGGRCGRSHALAAPVAGAQRGRGRGHHGGAARPV